MQFLTSAPNFREVSWPLDPAFPRPWSNLPTSPRANFYWLRYTIHAETDNVGDSCEMFISYIRLGLTTQWELLTQLTAGQRWNWIISVAMINALCGFLAAGSSVAGRRVVRAVASNRVFEYYRVVNCFLLLEYSLLSTPGCKFPFPFRLQFFCSQLINCWNLRKLCGFAISFVTCQPGNWSEYTHACSRPGPGLPLLFGPRVHWPTTPLSSLAACIKVLPILTSTRGLV